MKHDGDEKDILIIGNAGVNRMILCLPVRFSADKKATGSPLISNKDKRTGSGKSRTGLTP